MATHTISILGLNTLPNTSGNVYFEPHAINFGSNDRYPLLVGVFKDTATRDTLGFGFRVPQNYVGNPAFLIEYATTATTGDFDSEIDYTSVADGESLDPSADQENIAALTTVPGTARLMDVITITATAANFAVGDKVVGVLARDGADGDTVAASIYIFGLYFQYTDV